MNQVDALNFIVHKDFSLRARGKLIVISSENHSRQQFGFLSAAIGHKIGDKPPGYQGHFGQRTLLAKCYGGDVSRKRKLLEKQKKAVEAHESYRIKVEVPTRSRPYISVLSMDEE